MNISQIQNIVERATHIKKVDLQRNQVTKISLKKIYNSHSVKLLVKVPKILELSFNQDYGIKLDNIITGETNYMDQNIFNSQKKVDLMVTLFDDQIFVSINGLTFNDYIYSQLVDKSI